MRVRCSSLFSSGKTRHDIETGSAQGFEWHAGGLPDLEASRESISIPAVSGEEAPDNNLELFN